MKTKTKALLLALCALMLVAATVFGTLAYLTDVDTVENTFSIGRVSIKLDEAPVDGDGKAVTGEGVARVKENEYHLMPGQTYDKDPTVTVVAGSEASYIRAMLTMTKYNKLAAIFGADKLLNTLLPSIDAAHWTLQNADGVVDEADNTVTYEFRYVNTVSALEDGNDEDKELDDVELAPLFKEFVLPATVKNAELETIEGFKITVVAHAIQARGFDDADAAWFAFETEQAGD